MEEEIKELKNTISELQEKLEQSNEKLSNLEKFFSCENCGEVGSLHVCHYCGQKVCHFCYSKLERKDHRGREVIVYICKWCKD